MDRRDQLLGRTVAIVRAFNNPHVAKAVRRLITFGIGRVIVVTDAVRDKGATRGFLGDMVRDLKVHLIEMSEGYTWVNALNAALAAIAIENFGRTLREEDEFEFVLPISVEVNITERNLGVMLEMIALDSKMGAVGATFCGKQNGRMIELGASYGKPRNTCMVWRLAVFRELGYFDAWTDGIGGMEDLAFLLFMSMASSYCWTMLDQEEKVELIVGVHYDQAAKEAREQAAMKKIIVKFDGLVQSGPTQDRLAITFVRMGLIG